MILILLAGCISESMKQFRISSSDGGFSPSLVLKLCCCPRNFHGVPSAHQGLLCESLFEMILVSRRQRENFQITAPVFFIAMLVDLKLVVTLFFPTLLSLDFWLDQNDTAPSVCCPCSVIWVDCSSRSGASSMGDAYVEPKFTPSNSEKISPV